MKVIQSKYDAKRWLVISEIDIELFTGTLSDCYAFIKCVQENLIKSDKI